MGSERGCGAQALHAQRRTYRRSAGTHVVCRMHGGPWHVEKKTPGGPDSGVRASVQKEEACLRNTFTRR